MAAHFNRCRNLVLSRWISRNARTISVIISGNIAALPHIFFASILRIGIGIASLLTAYKPSKLRFIILLILASIWILMALILSILHFFVRKSADEAIVANCLKQSSSITLEQCERIVSAFHILNVVLPILTIIGPLFLFLCISGASLRYHAGSQHEQLLSNDEMNGEILPADRIEMEILDRELGIRLDVQEPEQDANEEQVVEK